MTMGIMLWLQPKITFFVSAILVLHYSISLKFALSGDDIKYALSHRKYEIKH